MSIHILDLRGHSPGVPEIRRLLPRSSQTPSAVTTEVSELIDKLCSGGEIELRKQVLSFDGVKLSNLRVPLEVLQKAEENLDPRLRMALETAIERVRGTSRALMPGDVFHRPANGANIQTKFAPIEKAGIYAPGGKAAYPSSVVMNAVPALVAGVQDITLFSPPQLNSGMPDSTVLAVAHMLGITNVIAAGGVGAVYAAAYGLPEMGLSACDVFVGPGNIYTTAAKRLLAHRMRIDGEAGPTEIMALADSYANPEFVAADLISQAEHDENAAAVCVTDSIGLAELIADYVETQTSREPNAERIDVALSSEQSNIVVVDGYKDMVKIANAWGAEHLSLQVENPRELSELITNAGAVFLGPHTPVSLGDYTAGSNHVLPTGNHSRFTSGVNVYTFLRTREIIEYSPAALGDVKQQASLIADAENLPAHASALTIRSNIRDRYSH